jgi:outer membrane murein-binding lipoprotein Lpp
VTSPLGAAGAAIVISVLLCGGCSQGAAQPASTDTGDLDAVNRQINRLNHRKQSLRSQIESLRSASGTGPAGDAPVAAAGEPSAARPTSVNGVVASSAAALGREFTVLDERLGGANGIAVVPVGRQDVVTWGSLADGAAWSTIKVPLAVAAVRADGRRPSATTARLVTRAVTASDNAAAESLWARLGPASAAASAVQAVLRDAGDGTTRVESRRVRPPYTAFGQTLWSLERQAVFAARLPCLGGAAPVVDAMGQVTSSQRWGLGTLGTGTLFKGGWGPGTDGGYLVRQLGVIPLPQGGMVAVAVAARPADGSFATGTAHLDAIATWLKSHLRDLPQGRC